MMMTTLLLAVAAGCLLLAFLVILRALWVLSEIRSANAIGNKKQRKPPQQSRTVPISTVVVLGSGGHTTEMLQLLQALNAQQYTPLTFVVAQTDTTSMRRVMAAAQQQQQQQQSQNQSDSPHNRRRLSADQVYHIPRSREVGQSYITSIATTLWSLIYTLGLVVKMRPGLLLCNGPGTCLPIAVWTFMGRLLGLWEGKIVFCESFCRVTSLSLTGKLLYPIVDLFVVHWEQLQAMYPKSHLVSTFVPRSASTTSSSSNPENKN